jgi:pimeloyl-ACP methyl ester carboxylesterase
VTVERWTSRSGIRVRYLDNAPADPVGLPILFSPGLTDLADDYGETLEFFLPRRVLVVDVRGRGKSEAPPTGYAVSDHLADLAAVVDEEGLERVHLMTFSRGTSWGMELAFTQPSRVATVSIGDYLAIEMKLPDDFGERMFQSRWRGEPVSERMPLHVLAELARQSVTRELWTDLGALGIPVLVAHGTERGVVVQPEAIERYRATVPGVEIVAIEGTGHDLFRGDRLAYPRAVADFLARRAPGL